MTQVFEAVEVFRGPRPVRLATGVGETLWVGGFSPGLPGMLGVRALVGREFTRDDVAAQDAVMLSEACWQRAFHRDPGVVGKTLALPDRTCVIAGVMPATFRYFVGARADAWLAIGDHDGLDLAARLRPGLTIAAAQRALDAGVARLPPRPRPLELRIWRADWTRGVAPVLSGVSLRTMLVSLMGAVGFVLLIACASVANTLLTRVVARRSELAMRASLGATRVDVFRQVLVEGVVVAALGGVAAIIAAWWIIASVPAIVPPDLVASVLAVSVAGMNGRVLAFVAIAALAAGLACAVVPAARAAHVRPLHGSLTGGGRLAGPPLGHRRLSRVLQASQIALTFVLLMGAGLFLRSLLHMVHTPENFDAAHLMYVRVAYPPQAFPRQDDKVRFAESLIERITTIPGVQAAAVGEPPASGGSSEDHLAPGGTPTGAGLVRTQRFRVGPDYFRVAGIRMLQGRSFGSQDQRGTQKVVVISENAATRLWPARSAVGERLVFDADGPAYTVVGVVPHVRTVDFANDCVELFFPATQFLVPPGLLIRVSGDVPLVARSIRDAARAVDSRAVVQNLGTLDQLFAETDPMGASRFYLRIFAVFAGVGLVTASVGLYGMLAFGVRQRTREIGVRVALGADPAAIRRLLARDAIGIAGPGLVAGFVAAMWLSSYLGSQLFRVSPHDPLIVTAIVLVLSVTAAVAAAVPLHAAIRLDPVEALRRE